LSSDSDGWLARDLKLVTRAAESRHRAISRADKANADIKKTSKMEQGGVTLQKKNSIVTTYHARIHFKMKTICLMDFLYSLLFQRRDAVQGH